MPSCDVLIVGGGPAGSTCARELVQHGLDVVVLDRASFPRDKVCAGWITPAVLTELEIDLPEYTQAGLMMQPITGFRVGLMDRPSEEIRYRRPVSYGIRRCEFDDYLLRRSGARLLLGQQLEALEWAGRRWRVNGEISAALVIGAGGHFCPVARHLGAAIGRAEHAVAAQEIEAQMLPVEQSQCAVRAELPELYFSPDLRGYGWCFRKGDYLNVGLGRRGSNKLSARVRSFASGLHSSGRIPPRFAGEPAQGSHRYRGHAYLLYNDTRRKLCDDGVLLVGDAAGLSYSRSGEGIRPAIESGLLAASVALKADGDFRGSRLACYQHQLERRFGRQRTGPTEDEGPPWKQALGQRLMAQGWFLRLAVINRWFLHTHVGPLAALSAAA